MALTHAQLEQFQRDGYTGPVEILSRELMGEIAEKLFLDLTRESFASIYTYGAHTNRDRHLTSAAVFDLVTHRKLASCLTQLLGPNVILWRTTTFYKPPIQGDQTVSIRFSEIDWHQGVDFTKPSVDVTGLHPAIGTTREENLKNMPVNITCWLAVDDATEESGTLIFAPGSHRLGAVPYVECNGGFHGTGLRAAIDGRLDTEHAVLVPVSAGSCLLFNNLVFHKSMPNRSPRRRLGIACRYVANDTPVYANGDPTGYDLSRWACIQVAGQDQAGINRIRPRSDLLFFD